MAPDSLSSTPNRSREKLPFPISSNPSPGPSQRPTVSTSLSSLPLTSELLITTHSAAPDPKLAALEQAINERNTLSAQNAQLWKLIEKQRAGYNKILKELERIRGERDSYKAKLGGNSFVKRDPTTKHSILQQSDDNFPTGLMPSSSAKTSLLAPPRSDSLPAMGQSSTSIDKSIDVSPTDTPSATSSPYASSSHLTDGAKSHSDLPASTPTQVFSLESPASNSASAPIRATKQSPVLRITTENNTPRETQSSVSLDSSAFSNMLLPPPDLGTSRDSRVSLPDEARRYIANMTDSPIPSNYVDSLVEKSSFTPSMGSSIQVSTPAPSSQSREIEMDDEDDEDDEEGTDNSEPRDISLPSDTPISVDAHSEESSRQMGASDASSSMLSTILQPEGGNGGAHAAVDDFPLPPSNTHLYPQRLAATRNVAASQSHTSQPIKHHDVVNPSVVRSQSGSIQHQSQTSDGESTFSMQAKISPFRALPLLSSDLPTTTISVSHSFIRPNDRGKEVLSFIVFVNPGNGKPSWKVEKMYSDVLSLDQRVRQSVGKSVGKKIASLPEGKLWKDHAPARVDQRKAILEHYLQTLINLPVKGNDEVIAFFTTDIVREKKQPVMQAGYKEGYLTKRGKNFGGWKTRFFVLQGPVLEYYDCRGGTHLGSIIVTGAQIGRQQRTDRSGTDDDKEYRHAFLIVEAKKGPGGHHPRHVLCAESDEERDSWVEMLVRYFTGTYTEVPLSTSAAPDAAGGQSSLPFNPTSSVSDNTSNSGTRSKGPIRGVSRDDISVAKNSAVPIPQLAPDTNNAKLFQTSASLDEPNPGRSSSPAKSLSYPSNERDELQTQNVSETQNFNASSPSERATGLASSLPEQSVLSSASTISAPTLDGIPNRAMALAPRANSELGHYPDFQFPNDVSNPKSPRRDSPEKRRSSAREQDRKSSHPSSVALNQSHSDRAPSPEKVDTSSRMKISGPMNGAPIPSGFKFGGHTEVTPTPSDRREKAKSRSFWAFGKMNGDKQANVSIPRAVFGVPLEESLEVAQICNLPAIVFRAVQYLESKKADQEEGIYRLSGSSAVIKSLKDKFNLEGDVDLLASDEYWDPHAIAGLLKSFLRELPASILTRELHLKFLAVIDFVDPQERIQELSQLIAMLPLPNYTLLRALTAHLILIVQNSAVNKMTMRNVGIVFSPTLGIPAGVFSLMLGEFNRVFNVDADNGDAGGTDGSSELYRRNSRRYSEAAADQLLGLSGRSLKVSSDAQSDGDDLEQDGESEITDGDATVESFASSNLTPQADQSFDLTPQTPTRPKISKASRTATSRDLQVSTTKPERSNRYSRVMGGLPTSPRPLHSPHQNGDTPNSWKGNSA